MSEKNIVSIYCAGGAGINIGTKVLSIPSSATGFADTEITLIDTSDSNLSAASKGMGTYLIPGLKGSGKNRTFSFEQVEPHIIPFLTKYKPREFNIVIFSLCGGSGSVAGPLIVRELLKRDLNVIAVCIGNASNGKEAENSLKTIATLQGISSLVKRPVVTRFYMNDNTMTRSLVDSQIESDVRALSVLLSNVNEGLDNTDLHNFLNFNKVTSVPPQLVDLIVYSHNQDSTPPSGYTAIAVASVLPTVDDMLLELNQPYGCDGFMPSGLTEGSASTIRPLHFILTNHLINDRMEKYKGIVDSFKEAEKILAGATILNVSEGYDNGGFIL